MEKNMDLLFNPKTVAIFGASNEQGKVGTLIMNNLVSSGYSGKVFPINPNKKYEGIEIFEYKVFLSIAKVPEKVDLAVIVVPGKYVKDTIEQCIEHDIKAAIVIPAGFGEAGGEGKKLEEELAEIAEKGDLKFVGPNSMGLWSASALLNINMSFLSPLPGKVAIISQSGSLSIVFSSELRRMGVGVKYIVSSGNEASLTFEDYLEYFLKDEEVTVVVGFVEGIRKGNKLIDN